MITSTVHHIPAPATVSPLAERIGHAVKVAGVAVFALAAFAGILVCALISEAVGRLRHGKNYEAGDGIGSAEDYES